MDVDDIVFQIKRKGTFDELRKQLYNDVLNDQLGKAFIERVNEYANQALERDPSLSTKSSAAFQATIMNELERAGLFQDLKQQILERLLQNEYYGKRTEEAIESVVRQER